MTIGGLAPQDMTAYTLPLTTPVAEGDLIYAILEMADADNLTENDSDFTVAALPKAGHLDLTDCKILSMENGKVRLQLAADNASDEKASGRICIAAYDGDRMTDMEMVSLAAAPGEGLLETVTLTCPAGGTVRMFVLDPDTYAPLWEADVLE